MTTIPDDMVERVARAIMERRGGCRVTDWGEAERNPNVSAALADARAAIEAMQPAILAERERCARIAEQMFTPDTVTKNAKGKPYQTGLTAIYAAMHIAAAIRSQS